MNRLIYNPMRFLLFGWSLVTFCSCSPSEPVNPSKLGLVPSANEQANLSAPQKIPMPQVETGADDQSFLRFSFPTPHHGLQTALLDQYAPYDYKEGSFQWRGKIEGQPNSKAVLTQYKNRVYITIEAGPAGAYEIRGDANEMLEVLELNRPAYKNTGKAGHHGVSPKDAVAHPQ